MSRRLQGIVVGVIIGAFLTGGIAYAVRVVPPSSSDRYYACVGSAGAVHEKTIHLNSTPTSCPYPSDKIRSWNAQGPTGATGGIGGTGATGATGPTGPPATTPAPVTTRSTVIDVPTAVGESTPLRFDLDTSGCSSISLLSGYKQTAPANRTDGMTLTFALLGRVADFPEIVGVNQQVTSWQSDPMDSHAYFVQAGPWSTVGVDDVAITISAGDQFNQGPVAFSVTHLAFDCTE